MKKLLGITVALLLMATPAYADNSNEDDNRNGDCRNSGDNCSDDDQMTVLVCVQPDSCRFG